MDAADRNDRAELAWKIAAGVLIATGIGLRYRGLAWMEFGRDQELLLLRALEAQGTLGAARGLRYSTGLYMPPFLLDLFALVLLVTKDPVRLAAFVVSINVVGLVLFHRFVRRQLGSRVALGTTVLLATMPWAILRSRSVWVPDCLFPFIALALLALAHAGPPWKLGKTCAAAAALAVLFQVHQPAWLLAPPLVLFAILFRLRIPRGHLLAAAAVFALFYARWLAHEVASGFDDVRWAWHARTSSVATPGGPAASSGSPAETVLWALRQTGAGGLEYLSPKVGSPAGLLPRAPVLAELAIGFAIVATAAAILLAVLRSASIFRARAGSPGDRAVALSTLVVVLVLAAYLVGGAASRPHYAVPLQPFLALLVAWALARWRADRAVLAAWAVAGALFAWRFEVGVETFPLELGGRYGIPYAAREQEWRDRLAAGFDAILHGEERRKATTERLRTGFDASEAVVLRRPELETQGTIEIAETPEGLAVSGCGPKNFLWLPAFDLPPGTVPTLRLDATLPAAADLVVGYKSFEDRSFGPGKVEVLHLAEGRGLRFAALQRPGPGERIALRFEVFHATIHDLEIRAVAAPPADASR